MGMREDDPHAYARFNCVDCGTNTHDHDEYYMVHDKVWHQAKMAPNGGMLCIGCLEQRLGRQLTGSDFTDAPINDGFCGQSFRLAERITTLP